MNSKKLLFIVNVDWFLVSHRLPIALEAIRRGQQVHLAAQFTDREDELKRLGIVCHPMKLDRRGGGPIEAARTVWFLARLLARLRPDVVHLVTLKPVIFGGIAARLTGTKNIIASISGLGFVFIAKGYGAWLRRNMVQLLLRIALGGEGTQVIFQNQTDEEEIRKHIGKQSLRTVVIPGSGVDLNKFHHTALPEGPVRVLMAARLLIDKGVREFLEAARILSAARPDLVFLLAGDPDPGNPASASMRQVQEWNVARQVEVMGHVQEMAALIPSCHLVVLPSYREGLPKVLVEAAACGRAVVTTDVPGCRDAIVPGQTGLIVPVGDAAALAAAIDHVTSDRNLLEKLGRAGRELAETRFDISAVVASHFEVYGSNQGSKLQPLASA